jgi:hypothetical protein
MAMDIFAPAYRAQLYPASENICGNRHVTYVATIEGTPFSIATEYDHDRKRSNLMTNSSMDQRKTPI